MRTLEDDAVMPGYTVEVTGRDADGLLLAGDNGPSRLPLPIAAKIYATR